MDSLTVEQIEQVEPVGEETSGGNPAAGNLAPIAPTAAPSSRPRQPALEPAELLNRSVAPLSQRLLRALDDAIGKLEAVDRARTEPIAIVGMSCRFPGASDPAAFWQLLSEGVDAVTEVPGDRWNVEAFYDPDPEVPGKMYTRWGGFLAQVDQFDAGFFGISPREAIKLDPQQRILLEVSWEALETAGLSPEHPHTTQTGVFVGITTNDYARLLMPQGDLSQIDAYYLTGNPLNAVAGRLSYTLGLQGPCMAIDTACSSSLVAIHTACQSLRNGECRQALAGGVNLILSPENTIALSKAKMLAPDGRCKTFDASANGIVRGEGCGVLVLKRLSDAIADGNPILALIRGSAVNQDGDSSGFTVPNKTAQEALLRTALQQARVHPLDLDYIEAHGTGTPLGDPIELRALESVFTPGRSADRPLQIGSVKTNIGHLESAAGVAGLIKLVLSLQHRQLPPHLHLQQPNPYFRWDAVPIAIPTQLTPWTAADKPRLAGVSSFGASGTNAHIILEEAPELPSGSLTSSPIAPPAPLHLLTLSAKTPAALQELCDRHARHLTDHPDLAIADLAFTLNSGRTPFKHRVALVARSTAEAQSQLAALAAGETPAGCFRGTADQVPAIAFLFTGQGSQFAGMGRQLYETQPIFRAALDHCHNLLLPHLERPLLEVLYPTTSEDAGLIDQTAYTQPALFALEYALYQLWTAWGCQPTWVLGHSVGEYVAACVAGVFSLEDALKLIAARGRLMQALPPTGAMVAVMARREQVQPLLDGSGSVAIAAVNGPRSLVLSGDRTAVDAICASLTAQGIKTKPLQVSHAFHSPLMAPMLADFRAVLSEVPFQPPQVKLVSNLTGQLASSEITTPDYWCRHILQAVQFAPSLDTLAQEGCGVLLELGAKPVLLGMGRACLPEPGRLWLPSLRAGQEDWQPLLESLAQLYVAGAPVQWEALEPENSQHLPLPTYPFQRQRVWIDPPVPGRLARVQPLRSPADHPLVGQRLHLAGASELRFETQLSQHSPAFLADHCIFGVPILPATGYLEMALSAAATVLKTTDLLLENVTIQQALMLSEDEVRAVQIVLHPAAESSYTFQIFSRSLTTEETPWVLHATGTVQADASPPPGATAPTLPPLAATENPAIAQYYQRLSDRGFHYGPAFRAIAHLSGEGDLPLGQIALPANLAADATPYLLHPALLDGCFQVLGTQFPDDGQQEVYLPTGVARLRLRRSPGRQVWSQVQRLETKSDNAHHLSADLELFDPTGQSVATLEGVSFRRVTQKAFLRTLRKALPAQPKGTEDWLYHLSWQPQALPFSQPLPAGTWILFADQQGIATALAAALQAEGDRPILIRRGETTGETGPDCYTLNPNHPEAYLDLLQRLQQSHPDCRGMVHCWSLDLEAAQSDSFSLGCGSVLSLVQAIAPWKNPPRLWLLTQAAQAVTATATPLNVQQAPLWGLGRVIALEHPELRCGRIDLDATPGMQAIAPLLAELRATAPEDQIAFRGGDRYVARLLPGAAPSLPDLPTTPFRLALSEYGLFEHLGLVPAERRSPAPHEVEIQVRAVGLNFRDVLNALGMLKDYTAQMGIATAADLPFGGECAGVVTAVGAAVTHVQVGDAVIAAQTIGSLASHVVVPADFVVLKPSNLSFEAAATIPTTFLTAYYGLYRQAQLKAGDRILIHAAAGGVGQAAIQLAQRVQAEIFATASPSKWEFLQSQGVTQVFHSRTLDYADAIQTLTQGRGVDVVLNSLNGDYIAKNLAALAPQGRFVEIGKLGIWSAAEMQAARADVDYLPFDLLDISLQTPRLIAEMLAELMPEFQQETLHPLPHRVFPIQDVVSAFRFMAQSKHIGKVVISIPAPVVAESRPVRDDGTYLITGGLGALGLKVAQWLVEQGARHLVLTGRRGLTAETQPAVAALEQAGATVWAAAVDVSDCSAVEHLLHQLPERLPPLRGVIHAAGILQDGLLSGQTWEQFRTVLAPKQEGAWHLHQLTETQPLDFFVCFSSVSALLGSPGQGNYAAANAFLDALAHHRRALGLPALSINWGPWGEVGMAATLGDREQSRMAAQGVQPIPPDQGIQILADLLNPRTSPQVGVLPVDWSRFRSQLPPTPFPFLETVTATVAAAAAAPPSELRQRLLAASASDRPALLLAHVRTQVARVLNLPSPDEIDPHQGFLDLGMDSLMAVELGNFLQSSLGCAVPPSLMFDYPNVAALVGYLAEAIAPSPAPAEATAEVAAAAVATAAPVSEPAIAASDLEDLSDSEAEALLLSKLDLLKF